MRDRPSSNPSTLTFFQDSLQDQVTILTSGSITHISMVAEDTVIKCVDMMKFP
jgi:hypothetical protein